MGFKQLELRQALTDGCYACFCCGLASRPWDNCLQDPKALIKFHFPSALSLFALLEEEPWHLQDKTERLTKWIKVWIRAQVDSSDKYTKPATKLSFEEEF